MLSVVSGYTSLGGPFYRKSGMLFQAAFVALSYGFWELLQGPRDGCCLLLLMGCMRIQICRGKENLPPPPWPWQRTGLCSLHAFSRCRAYGPVLRAPGWFGLVGLAEEAAGGESTERDLLLLQITALLSLIDGCCFICQTQAKAQETEQKYAAWAEQLCTAGTRMVLAWAPLVPGYHSARASL